MFRHIALCIAQMDGLLLAAGDVGTIRVWDMEHELARQARQAPWHMVLGNSSEMTVSE
jgi:hypothetical protein